LVFKYLFFVFPCLLSLSFKHKIDFGITDLFTQAFPFSKRSVGLVGEKIGKESILYLKDKETRKEEQKNKN